jgi:hypothetical protein
VKWESRTKGAFSTADPSLKSFLFTLQNPRNIPARTFALKADKKGQAIVCSSLWGPHFWDIFVPDGCNVKWGWIGLGDTYANDTHLPRDTVLTGSRNFTVKEIEVFQITA